MAHLGSSFTSYEAFLGLADAVYGVNLTALNNSGVEGTALVAVSFSDDVPYLNVSLSAYNLTPNVAHIQHIHGLVDPETGEALDSTTPTLASDADRDGFVEVLEGVPSYGDVLLSLLGGDGLMPTANEFGTSAFIQNYDLTDVSQFLSPVTGVQYSALDLLPATSREIVVHGLDVAPEYGAGTEGEVNGMQDGYVPILPAAAGEIEVMSDAAIDVLLATQRARASESFTGTVIADEIRGGAGDDMINGGDGDDMLFGEGDNDMIMGGAGADTITGGSEDDMLSGGAGADVFVYKTLADGADMITDFVDGEDMVDLSGIDGLRGSMVSIEDVDSGAMVMIGDTSILFLGVEASELSRADAIL
ncbi:M10 family metallopeptidase C-terminal domain-containing protein [Jannaschia formosa]|uniref:M10 family metallopeptidase C-terminal domain-containing protein n=1 Tax=Jannaschia formosa TaxID=2259592 RepID=UPI000E1C1273|nr:M10 family metallopeptidase C-terminal domain-containing protein [Jannaschia formosa]TFL17799.1 hypothetical protein DR046_12935 [Jannaschia formosa]